MNAATYFDSFLLQIKLATNRDRLQDISYRAMIHPGTTAQQASMITSLCVYRENIINGATDDDLAVCAKYLKIPKKLTNKIK